MLRHVVKFCAALGLIAAALSGPAHAQSMLGKVVTSCSSAQGVSAGGAAPFTVDVNGNLCFSGAASISSALPAGANIIGKVGIDQTTPGTTNGVQVNAALPAGTNVVGKFGIDQTTPGTTNGVQVNAALPAGTNVIGLVRPDTGTPGTTNAVNFLTTSNSGAGIAPAAAGAAASSLVLKASAGNLYRVFATCTAQCWLMVFNATSLPGNGATTAGIASGNLQDCIAINSGATGGVDYGAIPEVFANGITAAISSTSCGTLTASTVGFINGAAK